MIRIFIFKFTRNLHFFKFFDNFIRFLQYVLAILYKFLLFLVLHYFLLFGYSLLAFNYPKQKQFIETNTNHFQLYNLNKNFLYTYGELKKLSDRHSLFLVKRDQ